jgi:hypothetical protein
VQAGSPAFRAVSATMRALASTALPGGGDYETAFSPGKAFVRRVLGHNVWLLYRFNDDHVFVMATRNQPPVPLGDGP